MRNLRASVIQLRSTPDRADSLARAAELVGRAAGRGAELVALPELFCWRGPQENEPSVAEPIPGPTSEFASDLARRLRIHLVAGSILERSEIAGKCHNTALLFGPDGALLARYRKIHLFDVAVDDEVTVSESRTRAPGEQTSCITTELGRIGIAVCYDLRFPELFRSLAKQGAELVVLPSAFTATTGAAHWHTLVRARAIENQCYFLAPNQFGATALGYRNYGHSLIVDPWGRICAEAGENDEAVLECDLEAERLAEVRSAVPSLQHRRLPW
jgi:nitrilase